MSARALIPRLLRHPTLHMVVASLILTGVAGLTTRSTPPARDGLYYLDVAEHGLIGNPNLAAPFAYRFGTPLLVRALHLVSSFDIEDGFLLVAYLSAWGLLIAAWFLARAVGAAPMEALVVMAAVAFSFFHLKFPFAVPTVVDAQGFLFITVALWALVRGRFVVSLLVSCAGLFFKEFLVIPPALIILLKLQEYRRTRQTLPLVWVLCTICLTMLFLFVPRVVIPVTTGFGANAGWNFGTPSHWEYLRNLRYFLGKGDDAARLVNLCFALASYWLPVLLLATRERLKGAWEGMSSLRLACLLHLSIVLFLALVGGTNIMIFVAYTIPVLVIVLASILKGGVPPIELAVALTAVFLFNRIPVLMGGPVSTGEDVIRFYGGWWSQIDAVTAGRSLEIAGYLLLTWGVRFGTGRLKRTQ